ncbi:sugar phosphate isomerase/epimerase family protein [Emticicia agri]|uniref:Sugar phosphate isomerase/epimerase n=1 Tax=Emticicia agri TaxID=2492393 RepID=A0A4Q5M3K8_9BACT|nr:TIM barrel protein [Emticicia agri]RYU96908.1 sugar phosphate isomerase/epimerase [Emticicia agri]
MNRRNIIKGIGGGMMASFFHNELFAATDNQFRVGACDWSINNTGNLGAMEMAKRIGLDGVQVSLGSAENNMHLRNKDVQQAYKALADIFKVGFTGLGIGELNNIPYKSDNRTDEWVSDSIDVAKALGVKVVLLAFFFNGDLKNDPKGQEVVIKKFRQVAPKAERLGITLGIESWLSAEEHMKIIDAVGSKAIKCYYDVANSLQMGYDIYKEIRWLGKQNQICEFHFKENGYLLGKGMVDFMEVRRCIDEIGYTGCVQIEGAVPEGRSMFESYLQNNEFVKGLLK